MLDKFGVLHSDLPDVDLPNQNLWQFVYPRIKKWGSLTAYLGLDCVERNRAVRILCRYSQLAVTVQAINFARRTRFDYEQDVEMHNSETEESVSYEKLLERSLCWAKELKQFFNGSKPPLVAFILENSLEYVTLVLGCHAVGAPFCTLKHDINKDMIYLMVLQTKPSVLVIESTLYEDFKETINKTGVDVQIYVQGAAITGKKSVLNILLSGEMFDVSEAGKYDPESTAMLVYSSGTTGNPKAIISSHKSQTNALTIFTHPSIFPLRHADEGEQETLLANLPLAHAYGIMYYTVIAPLFGIKMVHFPYTNEEELVRHIRKFKIRYLPSRPSTIEALSKMDCSEDISSLKNIFSTGSPANYEVVKLLNEKLGNTIMFQEGYGATECNLICITPLNQPRLGMTGKMAPNCIAKVVDMSTGETIKEPHRLGEIWFTGPGLMEGYLNNPEATKEALDSDKWYHSGDIGYFDEDCFLKAIDRAKDFITVGDKQVSPFKIEMIIKQHPSVIDAGVVGIPDISTGGEVPKAFVILRTRDVEAEDIIRFVEERVPEEMRLTGGVSFVDKLPRNHLGKLVRKYLREMEWFK